MIDALRRIAPEGWEIDLETFGFGCPFCAGTMTARSESLAVLRPDLAEQWHPTKNRKGPGEVTWSSGYEATRQCPTVKSHIWLARVSDRTDVGTGCPACAIEAGKGGRRRTRNPVDTKKTPLIGTCRDG